MSFLEDAETFAAEHGRSLVFRLLQRYLACSDEELAWVVKKIYICSIPENTHEIPEAPLKVLLGVLALPGRLFLDKTLSWTPEASVDFDLETIDPAYFSRWFAAFYADLKGSKRLTPRASGAFPVPTVEPILSTASAKDLLRLVPTCLAALLPLYALSRKTGLPLAKAFRKALSLYTVFRGHFLRYPCRHFVTFDDQLNHPARYLAFRQLCPGDFIVVQNGERTKNPSFAYGLMDRYFVFGRTYARILKDMGVGARSFEPVGALCLNEFHQRLAPHLENPPAIEYDILYIDQGVSHNGLPEKTNRSIELILENLHIYQLKHPGCRLAYQLRPYSSPDSAAKQSVLASLKRRVPKAVVLENAERGTSYVNALKAELLMTFQSTLGFEMMRLGKKVLFVNYSGDPSETICSDERFQLEDPAARYAILEAKIDGLAALRLEAPPQEALDRHLAFDGRVQERMAALANGGKP